MLVIQEDLKYILNTQKFVFLNLNQNYIGKYNINMENIREAHYNKLRQIENIKLEAFPLFENSIKSKDMPVLVRVISGELPNDFKRDPVELCIVLDRSGSMEKRLKDCIKAIEKLLDKLMDEDIIHIIVYDEKVDIIVYNETIKAKDSILTKINNVKHRGTTNMFQAIENGISLLDNDNNLTKLMFLFSDGLSNKGLKGDSIGIETQKLTKKFNDFHIITYGIGSEFDEKLMSSIATSGKGHYYYIDEMEKISYLLDKGLDGYTKFWNKNAKLSYMLGNCEHPHEKIFKIRELSINQFIFNITPNFGDNYCELTFNLQSGNMSKSITISWNYNNSFNSTKNSQVKSYLLMNKCAKLNEDIEILIPFNNNENIRKLITEYKEKIIRYYESLLEHDEYLVIQPLLFKEKEFLETLRKSPLTIDTKLFQRTAMANTAYSGGVSNYVNSDSDGSEGDMGFGLFD